MTPAGTSNELDVQNGWEENTHTTHYFITYNSTDSNIKKHIKRLHGVRYFQPHHHHTAQQRRRVSMGISIYLSHIHLTTKSASRAKEYEAELLPFMYIFSQFFHLYNIRASYTNLVPTHTWFFTCGEVHHITFSEPCEPTYEHRISKRIDRARQNRPPKTNKHHLDLRPNTMIRLHTLHTETVTIVTTYYNIVNMYSILTAVYVHQDADISM